MAPTFALFLCISIFITHILAATTTVIIPPTPVPELSDVQFVSDTTAFEGPKVHPINTTTWDWWYFDAIQTPSSPGRQAAVVVTFYAATPAGFDLLANFASQGFTSLVLVEAVVTWPNGTLETYIFNSTEARITTVSNGNGASGVWEEYDSEAASFVGAPDMSVYEVYLESSWISGVVRLQSVTPPHYPCGPAGAGQNLKLAAHIGWANAMPDANADVRLTVRGQAFEFTGVGYHDKNWGDQNFASNVGSWYWGHGRLGDYSVVWFDFLSPQGQNHVSAYVSRGNEILVAQCSGITVRPFGENATYPPLITTGPPTGYRIIVALPDRELEITATGNRIIEGGVAGVPYTRWIGTVDGIVDGVALTGQALFEQFNFFT